MTEAKFTMKDENFTCLNCKKEVKKLNYTARNHCPYCLHSIHVDINPGDRKSTCKGVLIPTGIKLISKDRIKIIFKCNKCNEEKNNISALDDNMDLIIDLSKY